MPWTSSTTTWSVRWQTPDHHIDQRFILTGTDAFGRILVVVYTQPEEKSIRIISTRPATAAERRHYEQG
jgi:uncharacterized DUF497 family protein